MQCELNKMILMVHISSLMLLVILIASTSVVATSTLSSEEFVTTDTYVDTSTSESCEPGNVSSTLPFTTTSYTGTSIVTSASESSPLPSTTTPCPDLPPTEVDGEILENNSIKITWDIDCVNTDVTHFEVQITAKKSFSPLACTHIEDHEYLSADVKEREVIFTNTRAFTVYEVAVLAVTGRINYTSDIKTIITNPEDLPKPDVHAVVLDKNSINVTWEIVCTNANVTKFEINITAKESLSPFPCTSTPIGKPVIFNASVADGYKVIADMVPFTEYEVAVAVVTDAGRGEYGIEEIRTLPDNPPQPVVHVVLYNNSINITWEIICIDANVTRFEIKITAKESLSPFNCTHIGKPVFLNASEEDRHKVFNDVVPFTVYEVAVAVVTDLRRGEYGIKEITTPQEDLSAPSVHGIPLENNGIKITWKYDCVRANVTEFLITVSALQSLGLNCASSYKSKNQTVNSTERELIYDTTDSFTTYEVAVAAKTDDDIGTPGIDNVTTAEGIPPAPNVTATGVKSKIEIQWNMFECVQGNLTNFDISVNSLGYAGDGNCTPQDENQPYTKRISGDITNDEYENASPFSIYEVKVAAVTGKGQGNFTIVEVKTQEDEPEPVQDLKVVERKSNSSTAKIIWTEPCIHGRKKMYEIQISGSRSGFPHDIRPNNTTKNTEFIINDLRPEYEYQVTVEAVTSTDIRGMSNTTNFTQPASIPLQKEEISPPDPYKTDDPTTQAHIILSADLFDSTQGNIVYYAILLTEEAQIAVPQSDILDSKNCRDWNVTDEFQVTPLCWNPFKDAQRNKKKEFIIGKNTSCHCDHCNAPLKSDTTYYVKIRGYTKSTFADTNPVTFHTDSEVNAGMIAGVVVAILVMGVMAALFVMYRYGRVSWPPMNFLRKAPANNVRPEPIELKKFPAHCNHMLDIPARLSSEFQLLATLSVDIAATESFTAGQLPDNKRKNRYINILPYDSTRVKLEPDEDDPSSDYINASFIKGYTNDFEYIATQGPKEETLTDFWHMVYQQVVKVIVMVTQLEEQGKPKCYKYFPNLRENMVLGDLAVRCTTELNFAIYTSRTIVLVKDDRKRTIMHLHFREWPDFGCPSSTDVMLQFCQVVRHHSMLSQPCLTLVHCSAGVGRTGTLIAVDILLQHIKENKKVDIFGTVYKLRKQRINMVQSEAQYIYIFKCIKDTLQDPSYLQPEKASTSSMEPIYENISSIQYEKIPETKMKSNSSESECEL